MGITGIIAKRPHPKYEEELRLMLSALKHHPRTQVGTYVNSDVGVYLGWTTREGRIELPVWNRDHTAALVFLGEGAAPAPGSADWSSPTFLRGLRTASSGIVVDLARTRAVVFNDRYGFSRQYYHEGTDAFLFASEAKSLLRVRATLRTIDYDALAEYFAVGCPLEQRTLFSGISTVPAASCWVFERGRAPQKLTYFSPAEWEEQPSLDAETYCHRVAETFGSIMPRYLTGAPRIAVSVTGGLDSRMILAGQRLEPGSVCCYTFAGPDDETLDVRLGRRVAARLSQRHQVLRLGRDFFDGFPELATRTVYVTDGTFGVSGAHEIYLNRLAAEIAPLRLTGNYGSEVFRNVTTLAPLGLRAEMFSGGFQEAVRDAQERFRPLAGRSPLTFTLFEELPRVHFACQAAAQSEVDVTTPFVDAELARLLYQAPASLRGSSAVQLRYIRERSDLMNIPTDSGLGGKIPRWMESVQRMKYKAGFKLDYWKVSGLPGALGALDPLLRAVAASGTLPGPHRYLRYPAWFGDQLSEFVSDTLSDSVTAQRSHVNRAFLKRLLELRPEARAGASHEIDRLLTIELMYRLLVEGAGFPHFSVLPEELNAHQHTHTCRQL